MTTESKTLLENIAAGDNEAFKTLFDVFFPKVKVFLVKFLKDDKAAEDIAQDIFVKIWTFGPTSKRKSPNDAKRFIKAEYCTTDGELAQIENYSPIRI